MFALAMYDNRPDLINLHYIDVNFSFHLVFQIVYFMFLSRKSNLLLLKTEFAFYDLMKFVSKLELRMIDVLMFQQAMRIWGIKELLNLLIMHLHFSLEFFSNWKQPVAFMFTNEEMKSDDVKIIILDTIDHLLSINLHVCSCCK